MSWRCDNQISKSFILLTRNHTQLLIMNTAGSFCGHTAFKVATRFRALVPIFHAGRSSCIVPRLRLPSYANSGDFTVTVSKHSGLPTGSRGEKIAELSIHQACTTTIQAVARAVAESATIRPQDSDAAVDVSVAVSPAYELRHPLTSFQVPGPA